MSSEVCQEGGAFRGRLWWDDDGFWGNMRRLSHNWGLACGLGFDLLWRLSVSMKLKLSFDTQCWAVTSSLLRLLSMSIHMRNPGTLIRNLIKFWALILAFECWLVTSASSSDWCAHFVIQTFFAERFCSNWRKFQTTSLMDCLEDFSRKQVLVITKK